MLRDLQGPRQIAVIRQVVAGLLAAELVAPSSMLWFVSGWATDIEILDNGTRAFASLRPDWPMGPIRMTEVLAGIAARGGRVAAVLREEPHNEEFLTRLRATQAGVPGRIGIVVAADAHDKCLVGDGFVLDGSLNFTWSAMTSGNDHALLRADAKAAADRRIGLHGEWHERLRWA